MYRLILVALFAIAGSIHSAPFADQSGPRDFQLGFKQPGSVLARTITVRSDNVTHIEEIYTPGSITFVDARDQTNGTGGYVGYYSGGIRDIVVRLNFRSVAGREQDIHFVIQVWTDQTPYVAAAGFHRGTLTDHSFLEYMQNFVYNARDDGSVIIFGVTSEAEEGEKFTYMETFDLSADQNGGFVHVRSEVENVTTLSVAFRSVASYKALNVTLAIYAEEQENGGHNFRLGRLGPGMKLLNSANFTVDAVDGESVTGNMVIQQENSQIMFVQARDRVPNGTSRLVEVVSGGLGSNNMTLSIESGVDEPLNFTFDIYGVEDWGTGLE